MNAELEQLLENVARECETGMCTPKGLEGDTATILKARLLPLLEAGEKMRDAWNMEGYDGMGKEWDDAKLIR